MAAPPIPRISYFGDSIANLALPQGINIDQRTPNSEVITSGLNQSNFNDTVEFSEFEKTIAHYVLAMLGAPLVRVELTPLQLKMVIDQAITKLNYHAPLATKQYAIFEASAGCNIYELPYWMLENLEYVVYRKTLFAITQAGTIESDFFIKYFQDNYLNNDFDIGEFYLLQMSLEQLRKVLGQEGSYSVIDNKYLLLHPMPVTTPDHVIVEYRAINTKTIQPYYRNWIQRYALALAKIPLGQERSKYSILPSPGGGATLNGKELISEGMKDRELLEIELMEEIEEPPTPFTLY